MTFYNFKFKKFNAIHHITSTTINQFESIKIDQFKYIYFLSKRFRCIVRSKLSDSSRRTVRACVCVDNSL